MARKLYLLVAAVLLLTASYSLADEPQNIGNDDAASSSSYQITDGESKDGYNRRDNSDNSYKQEKNDNSYEQPKNDYKSSPYESEKNERPYGQESAHTESFAQPIPEQQSTPATLAQLYQKPTTNTYGSYGSNHYSHPKNTNNNRLQVLYMTQFERDFDQVNPRLNTSQWRWDTDAAGTLPTDNAAFVRHRVVEKPVHTKYGKPSPYQKRSSEKDYLEMISVPFARYFNQSSSLANSKPYDEAQIITKTNFTANSAQRILFRLKFACKIINAGLHPFPSKLVTNPWDDLRLANCAFRVQDRQTNSVGVLLTNEGVWAWYYHTGVSATDLPFVAKRRIGVRNSYNAIVDAAVEYDGRLNTVNWYLNGYRVWSISMLGVPPPADGVTKVDLGQGTSQSMYNRSTEFDVRIATAKCLDESDPNNQNSQQRLVAVLPPNVTYYGANDTFYDPNNLRSNVLFGQGAIVKLYKMLVLREDSVAPPAPQPLPVVYGSNVNEALQQLPPLRARRRHLPPAFRLSKSGKLITD